MRWPMIVAVLAGCAKQSQSPCSTAYADYQRTWKVAWKTELTELTATGSNAPVFDDKTTDDLVTDLADSLPTRAELAKLREVHTAGNGGRADPPVWTAAWAAAEHAIDVCGDNVKRPTPR